MKIRTDFVTNSSGSCFTVEVSVYDKSGNKYSIEDSPLDYDPDQGGEAYFTKELASAMTEYAYLDLKKLKDKYELKEVEQEGRNERIEAVKVGDPVRLVKIEQDVEEDEYGYGYGYGTSDNLTIDIQNENGSLGILPGEAAWIIADFLDNEKVTLIAEVAEVTPLSKRRKNAKKAFISIHIEAKVEAGSSPLRFSNIEELCDFLTESIEDDCRDDDDEDFDPDDEYVEDFEEWEYRPSSNHKADLEESKKAFSERVIAKVKTIDNISSIVVERNYDAWGEFAVLVADNDAKLGQLAKKVRGSSGEERNKAKQELLEYIHTSDADRGFSGFGTGFDDFRYIWNGDDKALEELVKRLGGNYGPDSVSGKEHCEIDLKTGKYIKYAEFVLN